MASTVTEGAPAYDPGDLYDEAIDARGRPRPGYDRVLAALADAEPVELLDRMRAEIRRIGVTFGARRLLPVCPIPRLIHDSEWVRIERGLAQRAQALNAFIADVYGDRQIVRAGVIGWDVVGAADNYEPAMDGLSQAAGPAAVVGFDLVRGTDGELRVLEDNLRTPSGLAYTAALRRATDSAFPLRERRRREIDPSFGALRLALEEAAGGAPDPSIALVTDGPSNSAWWEHRTLAHRLGIPLVTPQELRLRGGRLCVAPASGKLRPLDVVYRRTDEDRLFDARGRPTWLGELLLEPLRRGRLGIVNQPGAGVADDKLVHAYVEDMIRFYLGEEPLIESVRTFDLSRSDVRTAILGRLSRAVVKPRAGQGGDGVAIGSRMGAGERAEVADAVRADPEQFVAQETICLSRMPAIDDDGSLQPRHVDLRVFAVGTGSRTTVLPAPLTRVALRDGSMIVNSSQGGGAKDTWIIDGD